MKTLSLGLRSPIPFASCEYDLFVNAIYQRFVNTYGSNLKRSVLILFSPQMVAYNSHYFSAFFPQLIVC